MIRNILLAIDDTAPSRAAQDLAMRVATERGAELSALGVVDRPWITAPTPMPIGGGAFKQHRDETLLARSREATQQRLAAFRQRCIDVGLSCREFAVEGVPHEQIALEAPRHDLIAIGRDTDFRDSEHPDIAETVTQLLRDTPRPVLVVPAAPPPGDRIVIGFDGGVQASRAMHMFILLGLADGREVHIVHVGETDSAADAQVQRALGLFQAHGIAATPHGIAADGNPADVLIGCLRGLGAGMLVMGAFSRHGLVHRVFVGSATRRMLEACPVPLFVYH